MTTSKPYPTEICHPCGVEYGYRLPLLASIYHGRCGVCGAVGHVTEPRDYGHLREGWQNHVEK